MIKVGLGEGEEEEENKQLFPIQCLISQAHHF